jgi:hypothetical protein
MKESPASSYELLAGPTQRVGRAAMPTESALLSVCVYIPFLPSLQGIEDLDHFV